MIGTSVMKELEKYRHETSLILSVIEGSNAKSDTFFVQNCLE